MASVLSLGLHQPCAVPYLTDESFVPDQASPTSYTWQVYPVYDVTGKEFTEDEIVRTKNRVVWSRGGIVKRGFNLDVEDEEIIQSFVTRFRVSGALAHQHSGTATLPGADKEERLHASESTSRAPEPNERDLGEALVVILKTKAHIYFLTGHSHIVSFPFEVEAAFPTPQGCILQRKSPTSAVGPATLSAPHNSFVSSQLATSLRKPQQVTLKNASSSRPSLTLSAAARHLSGPPAVHAAFIPSVFSLTDPQAELGVAVRRARSQASARVSAQDLEEPFDPAEEILYISRSNELHSSGVPTLEPLLLAVTWNARSGTITVWKVVYRGRDRRNSSTKRKKLSYEGSAPRRRSSNLCRVNGSTTPIGRGLGESRDSLERQLGRSFPEKSLSHRHEEQKSSEVENLATELAPDFVEVGVQTRAARRVSSMLARTDLSIGPDRASINGFAANNPGRKSLNRSAPRDESVSEFRDRQSFGARPGSALPIASSFLANETSFVGRPIDTLREGPSAGGDLEGFDSMVLDDAVSELPSEVSFSKVHSLPCSTPAPANQPLKSGFDVFTLVTGRPGMTGSAAVARLSICILDNKKAELSVIALEALATSISSKRSKSNSQSNIQRGSLDLSMVNVQRGTNIIDACKICDGDKCCMLVLTQTQDGQAALLLEAVGISSIGVDLPNQFMIYDPSGISAVNQPDRKREGGRGRVLKGPLRTITALENPSIRGRVDLVDSKAQRHRLRIQLEPHHSQVRKILKIVEFTLQDKGGSGISVAWIEVMRWLRPKRRGTSLEWSAMVVTLFSMIVPFLSDKRGRGRPGTRQKTGGLLRSSSAAGVDMGRWNEMMDEECSMCGTSPAWSASPGWQWSRRGTDLSKTPLSSPKSSHPSSSTITQPIFEGKKNLFLTQCVSWTREFMETPVGIQMRGPGGFLPPAPREDRESRRTVVGSVLLALHLLREECKLDIRSSQSDENEIQLAPVLAQIAQWLDWPSWGVREGGYYYSEIPAVEQLLFDENKFATLEPPSQPCVPPSIFEFAEASFSSPPVRPFLTLLDVAGIHGLVGAGPLASTVKSLTPRTFALLEFLSRSASLGSRTAKVEWMCDCGLDAEMLATLPVGISTCLYDAISSCKSSPLSSWSEPLLHLIGRDDLKTRSSPVNSQVPTSKSHSMISHEATKDYHTIGNLILDTEPAHFWDASSEADRQGTTRLIFREDRRFQDASRLVNQLRVPVAECHSEPGWSEADLLDAQRELVQLVTMRTLTVASGRGMMNYSSRVPLLTEKVPVPAFTLQCQVRPSNVTFSADRASFTEDRAVWAFFHNGVAAGLTISKDAMGIDTSWILYNKPPELTNRHAGFLLALGLNGHLKSLAKWVAFKYLTPKHTMTSVGLLLGLSASYLGTMDTLITRLLSVHVTRMLPPGAAELNLSPLTQTTGIMGIGLLYCSSQHRRMSEVMLSEIENNDVEEGVPPEQILRDEGYRLAAGFALGFISLGQGRRLHGLHDMRVMERLLTIAIGTKNVNLVHVLDRATSGATIAFALIYMKTNDGSIARKIDIPDTPHQFDYVRPDIFFLRTVARHLIMWSSVQPTYDFIRASLPKAYRHRASLFSTHRLNSEDMPFFNILAGLCLALGLRYAGSGSHVVRDLLTAYLDQFMRLTRLPAQNYDAKLTRNAVRNCQDVTALAAAAVMAGTGDITVFRRLRSLHGRVDPDTPYGSHLAAHMAIGILFLGGGTYTLGTSDIAVAALLCAFYPLFPTSVMDNQAHLQAFRHLWVLAAEPRCVITRDVESGKPVSLPIVVIMKDDGEEERRLTSPCLVPELDSIEEIKTDAQWYWDVRVSFEGKDGEVRKEGFRKNHLNVYLRRRAAYDAPKGSVFVSEMQALAEQGPAPSVRLSSATPVTAGGGGGGGGAAGVAGKGNPFEWLWDLEVFKELDVSERALVLPHALVAMSGAGPESGNRYLKGTVVDTRLQLEHGILQDRPAEGAEGLERDKLWQLRLLFAWVDALDREELENQSKREQSGEAKGEGGEGERENKDERGRERQRGGNRLRREVIERLRWRVWKIGAGVDVDVDVDVDADDRAANDDGDKGAGESESGQG